MNTKNILKILYRAPVRTFLIVFLFMSLSTLSISRACEYLITARELTREIEFYNPIGTIRADANRLSAYIKSESGFGSFGIAEGSDQYWQDSADTVPLSSEDKAIIQNSKYVSMVDDRSVSAGISEKYVTLLEEPTRWGNDGIDSILGSFGLTSLFYEGTIQSVAGAGFKVKPTKTILAYPGLIDKSIIDGSLFITPFSVKYGQLELSSDIQNKMQVGSSFFFASIYDKGRLEYNSYCQVPIFPIDSVSNNYIDTAAEFKSRDVAQPFKPAFKLSTAELIDVIKSNMHTFNMVYTQDTSMLMGVAKNNMYFVGGRGLTPEDDANASRVCVISADLATTYQLDVGDTIDLSIRCSSSKHEGSIYGSILTYIPDTTGRSNDSTWMRQLNFPDSSSDPSVVFNLPLTDETFKIVGIYSYAEHNYDNPECYPLNTIFVPRSCYPNEGVDSPDLPSTFSFRLNSPDDAKAFFNEIEPFLKKQGLEVVLYDRGYSYRSGAFDQMKNSSFIGMVAVGIVSSMTIFLISFLIVNKRKNEFAIMRALGASKSKAIKVELKILLTQGFVGISTGSMLAWIIAQKAVSKNFSKALSQGVLPSEITFDYSLPFLLPIGLGVIMFGFLGCVAYFCLNFLAKQPILELFNNSRVKNNGFKSEEKATLHNEDVLHSKKSITKSYDDNARYAISLKSKHLNSNFVLRYVLKHIGRNVVRNVFILMVSSILLAALGQFSFIIRTNDENISEMYKTSDVYGYIKNIDGSLKQRIPYGVVTEIAESGFVESYYGGASDPLHYISPSLSSENDDFMTHAINDIEIYSELYGKKLKVDYMQGYNDEVFKGNDLLCVVSKQFIDILGFEYGDTIHVSGINPDRDRTNITGVSLKIIGSYTKPDGALSSSDVEFDLFIPFLTMNAINKNYYSNSSYYRSVCEFARFRMNNSRLPEFNMFRKHVADIFENTSDEELRKLTFLLKDEELYNVIEPLVQNNNLLKTLYPFAVVIILLIVCALSGLVIIHQTRECAIMRMLGTPKSITIAILSTTQMFICVIGVVIGIAIIIIWHGQNTQHIIKDVIQLAIIFMASNFISSVACSGVTCGKNVMDLLQIKE